MFKGVPRNNTGTGASYIENAEYVVNGGTIYGPPTPLEPTSLNLQIGLNPICPTQEKHEHFC